MMRTVYKYKVPLDDKPQIVRMPESAQILNVAVQGGEPHLWALVCPRYVEVERTFQWFPTGGTPSVDDRMRYVGTVHLHNGALVFHLFEIMPGPSL